MLDASVRLSGGASEVPVHAGSKCAVWALDGCVGRWQRARDRGVAVWPGRVAVRLGQLLSTNPADTITDFSRLCVFQEVHELFQDYELKYCYVDRNKRTGERAVPSTSSCFDFACSYSRAGKLAVFSSVFFPCWELNLGPLRVMASIPPLNSIPYQLWSF